MRSLLRTLFVPGLLVVLALISTGCCPGYKPYNVIVTLSDALADPDHAQTVQVDLIAVNESDYRQLRDEPMSQYWRDAVNPSFISAWPRKVLTFSGGKEQRVNKDDPIWKEWLKRGRYLFVLSNTPARTTDQPGTADPRRKIFPLDACQWPGGTNDIRVLVTPVGLRTLTPPKDSWQVP
jgi:hypothetical protein